MSRASLICTLLLAAACQSRESPAPSSKDTPAATQSAAAAGQTTSPAVPAQPAAGLPPTSIEVKDIEVKEPVRIERKVTVGQRYRFELFRTDNAKPGPRLEIYAHGAVKSADADRIVLDIAVDKMAQGATQIAAGSGAKLEATVSRTGAEVKVIEGSGLEPYHQDLVALAGGMCPLPEEAHKPGEEWTTPAGEKIGFHAVEQNGPDQFARFRVDVDDDKAKLIMTRSMRFHLGDGYAGTCYVEKQHETGEAKPHVQTYDALIARVQ